MQFKDIRSKFLETLPKHIGFGRIISQLNLDQGDSTQRLGTLTTLLHVLDDSSLRTDAQNIIGITEDQAFNVLEVRPGWYVRSPNPASGWENDPRQTSRDQLSILKLGMVSAGMTRRLFRILFAQTLRAGFAQNYWSGTSYQIPDVPTPAELSAYLRGFLGPWSIIPNTIFDLSFFVDLLLRKPDNWDSDNMLATNLLFANLKYPTIWSRFAMKFYLNTNFMDRLWNYHKDAGGNNGCEPLYWLFRAVFLVKFDYEPRSAP
jgi:hypothetical protein